jgi:hypothetical protein
MSVYSHAWFSCSTTETHCDNAEHLWQILVLMFCNELMVALMLSQVNLHVLHVVQDDAKMHDM